jgi:hypothetical protein
LYGGSFKAPSSALPAPGVENASANVNENIKPRFSIMVFPSDGSSLPVSSFCERQTTARERQTTARERGR